MAKEPVDVGLVAAFEELLKVARRSITMHQKPMKTVGTDASN